jgi:Cyclic nucleotide-binding domain
MIGTSPSCPSVQKSKVQSFCHRTHVNRGYRQSTVGIFGEHDFVGESGLAGRFPRMSSATAMTDCVLMRIDKKAMSLAIRNWRTSSASCNRNYPGYGKD